MMRILNVRATGRCFAAETCQGFAQLPHHLKIRTVSQLQPAIQIAAPALLKGTCSLEDLIRWRNRHTPGIRPGR